MTNRMGFYKEDEYYHYNIFLVLHISLKKNFSLNPLDSFVIV